MIRFLWRVVIFLASAALGLWVASLLLDDVHLHAGGFVVAVVVFAVVQSVLAPFIAKLVQQYARAFLGGVGLLATLVALIVSTLVSDGLEIDGLRTWLLATLVVWVVTAIATTLLPVFVAKRAVRATRSGTRTGAAGTDGAGRTA
ncbi:MAG TPA: hypothetical protein VGC04_02505 [Cellulomonas sp.]